MDIVWNIFDKLCINYIHLFKATLVVMLGPPPPLSHRNYATVRFFVLHCAVGTFSEQLG